MARRGIPISEKAIKIDPVVHLWALRILVVLGEHREFVSTCVSLQKLFLIADERGLPSF